MTNAGRDGTPLVGRWGDLLPVESWRAWLSDGSSCAEDWDALPDALVCVYAYHQGGARTRMRNVDVYPPPPGCGSVDKLGAQVGDTDGPEWFALKARIDAEAGA